MNKEKFITIQNDLYLSEDVKDKELVIYALILKNYNKAKEESFISLNVLKQFMQVENRNQYLMDIIRESVKNLIKKGLLGKITNLKEENVDIEELKNDDLFYIEVTDFADNYFCVQENQLFKLFKYLSTSKVNKFSLARYYMAICRVINNDSCFGYLTQNSVKKIVEWGKTATSYNKILKDLGLIIYNNDFLTKEKHYCTTFFSLPEHEVNFNKQLKQEVQRQGLIKIDKTSSNIKRSLTQKKNKAIKENLDKLESIDHKEDNFDIDFKEIKEMNDNINTYNKNKALEKANKVFDKMYSNLN